MVMFDFCVLAEVSMDEGCRMPMILSIMDMKQWRGEQRTEHRQNAKKRIEPSHAVPILVHVE
jgi:hypothetical protein